MAQNDPPTETLKTNSLGLNKLQRIRFILRVNSNGKIIIETFPVLYLLVIIIVIVVVLM
jgi:hypothetical protein